MSPPNMYSKQSGCIRASLNQLNLTCNELCANQQKHNFGKLTVRKTLLRSPHFTGLFAKLSRYEVNCSIPSIKMYNLWVPHITDQATKPAMRKRSITFLILKENTRFIISNRSNIIFISIIVLQPSTLRFASNTILRNITVEITKL